MKILILVMLVHLCSCGTESSHGDVKSERAPIERRFKFLGTFKNCSWKSEKINDGIFSGIGPTVTKFYGFIILEEQFSAKNLNVTDKVPSEIFGISKGSYSWLGNESIDKQEMPKNHSGFFLFDTSRKIVYFECFVGG